MKVHEDRNCFISPIICELLWDNCKKSGLWKSWLSHFGVLVLNHSSNNTVFQSLKKQRKWRSACTRLMDVHNVLIVLHFSVHHPIKKITLDLRTRLKMDKLVKLLHLISLDKQSKVVL